MKHAHSRAHSHTLTLTRTSLLQFSTERSETLTASAQTSRPRPFLPPPRANARHHRHPFSICVLGTCDPLPLPCITMNSPPLSTLKCAFFQIHQIARLLPLLVCSLAHACQALAKRFSPAAFLCTARALPCRSCLRSQYLFPASCFLLVPLLPPPLSLCRPLLCRWLLAASRFVCFLVPPPAGVQNHRLILPSL